MHATYCCMMTSNHYHQSPLLPPPTASTAPPSTTVTQGPPSSPMTGSTLRDWEIGLIVANVAFVMILVLILAVGCFVIRRRRDQPAKRAPVAKDKPRPESMIEHIQLLEEEAEEVDFMGEWKSHTTYCQLVPLLCA